MLKFWFVAIAASGIPGIIGGLKIVARGADKKDKAAA